ncbi:MAG: FxLYD domain-containing protein [Parafannyhessea umbonata]|jgi:hypothetical protein|uniref:Lipoprotein n=1 Tax=Parafannyhessea umbonata TaxID=604330 RepID=A0A6N7WRM8_9ACTN|nr:FxLYD domain-containing protein [Parafannyhessea umbonata]MCI7218931.1 FxLYD domain-containing protein [Parafannyhessea umbonata]MDD6358951.1 FxLYD domain-containing protein [Parafannyhessea umbonata]MDD6565993.1 FxLYD domain-containing protein [Parafannyhessea umbonata]MDY4419057.1 FxLYD domain-containing protein [Parafannyhessea umbonata]MST59438.1 hypothetical protein [Parafannyhessea umbonata]
MRKRLLGICAALLLLVGISACGGNSGNKDASTSNDYADDSAMQVIASGLEARWRLTDQQDASGKEATATDYKKWIDAELKKDKPLRNRKFKNSDMQKDVIDYIKLLEDSRKVVEKYPMSGGDFWTKWDETYDKRTAVIKKFVDKYDLKVSDQYADTLKELVDNGKAAQAQNDEKEAVNALVSSLQWSTTDDGYGSYTLTATGQNTTKYNIKDLSIVLSLYDQSGVKQEETYTSIDSWKAGETVKLEAYPSAAPARVEASVDYFDTSSE